MRWHFGGNFEPVLMTCKFNWTDCPIALVYYVWYEAVTDVIHCLTNESILWTISAILSICIAATYLVYWKIQWMKESTWRKENLVEVDTKINDLELKVNILSYKAQYGSWPLLNFTNNHVRKLSSIQSAVAQLGDKNAWLNYLLLSKEKLNKKKLASNEYNRLPTKDKHIYAIEDKRITWKNGDTSSRTPNPRNEKSLKNSSKMKQTKSTLSNDRHNEKSRRIKNSYSKDTLDCANSTRDFAECNFKAKVHSSGDNSYVKHISLGTKINGQGEDDADVCQYRLGYVSDNMLSGEKASLDANNKDEKLKPLSKKPSDSNIIPMKFEEETFNAHSVDTKMAQRIHTTLHGVEESLGSTHLNLQNYRGKDSSEAVLISDRKWIKTVGNPKEDDFSKESCGDNNDRLNDAWHKYNYERTICLESSLTTDDISNNITKDPNYSSFTKNERPNMEFDGFINCEQYSSFERVEFKENQMEDQKQAEPSNMLSIKNQPSDSKGEWDERLLENNIFSKSYSAEFDKFEGDGKYLLMNYKLLTNNEMANNFTKTSFPDCFKKKDSMNKSTVALMQEALRIKKELLLRIELKKDKSEKHNDNADTQGKNNLERLSIESRSQRQILDRIAEESSNEVFSTDKKMSKHLSKKKIDGIYKSQLQSNDNVYLNNENFINVKSSKTNSIIEQEKICFKNFDNDKSCRIFNEKNNEISQFQDNRDFPLDTDNINLEDNNSKDCLCIPHYLNDEINSISTVHSINTYQNHDSLNLPTDYAVNNLTDSSSDISVNKLIDRLIENERQKNSPKSLSMLKIDSVNHLNGSMQFQNEKYDNFFIKFENFYKEIETHSGNQGDSVFKDNPKICLNNNSSEPILNNVESQNNNNMSISEIKELTNVNMETENGKIVKKDEVDFDNKSELYLHNYQLHEEDDNNKAANVSNGIVQKNLSCGDNKSSAVESNSIPINQKKILYHASCTIPGDKYPSSMIRNSEQNIIKVFKNVSSNTMQRVVKNNSDPTNNKQLKTNKSNLSLPSIDKTNLLSHKKSKSYIFPRDICINPDEKKLLIESSTCSKKSFANARANKESNNYHKIKKTDSQTQSENLYGLANITSSSILQFDTLETSEKVLNERPDLKFKKENDSLKCSKISNNKSEICCTPLNFDVGNQINNDNSYERSYVESLSLASESIPESCTVSSNDALKDILGVNYESCDADSTEKSVTVIFNGCRVGEHKNLNNDFNDLAEENEVSFPSEYDAHQLQEVSSCNENPIFYVNFINKDGEITTKALSAEQFSEYSEDRDIRKMKSIC